MRTANTDVDVGSMDLTAVRDLVPLKETDHLISVLLGHGHSRSAVLTKVGGWLTGVCGVPNVPILHTALAVWVGAADLRRTSRQPAPVRTGPPPISGRLADAPTVEPSNPRARLADPLPADQPVAEYDGTRWHRNEGTDEVPIPLPAEKE